MKRISRRIISIALALGLCLSFSAFGAFADGTAPKQAGTIGTSSAAKRGAVNTNNPNFRIKLEQKDITGLLNARSNVNFSSARLGDKAGITADSEDATLPDGLEKNGATAAAENTPPVAGLYGVPLNPETMIGNEYTTQTQFAFFWQIGDTMLTYDPDGDDITGIFVVGIPDGSIIAVVDEGFAVQFSAPGEYTMYYYVQDARGAYSNTVSYTLNIVSPSVGLQVFEGTVDGNTASQAIPIAVDFSQQDSVAVAIVNKSLGNLGATLFNENGVQVGNSYNSFNAEPNLYISKSQYVVNRPAGAEGIKNYTLKIRGDIGVKYRVSVGTKSDLADMLGGLANVAPLRRNTNVRDMPSFNAVNYMPNSFEDYYSFHYSSFDEYTTFAASGQMSSNVHIKILDPVTFEILYDSVRDPVRPVRDSPWRTIRRAFGTLPDGDYYVVVYTPENLRPSNVPLFNESYNLSVGNGYARQSSRTITFPSKTFTTNSQEIVSLNLTDYPVSAVLRNVDPLPGVSSSKIDSWGMRVGNQYWLSTHSLFNVVPGPYYWANGLYQTWVKTSSFTGSLNLKMSYRLTYIYFIGD